MTNTRRFQLIGPHRRVWTAGIAAFAFSTIAVLATACGGGGSGGAGGSANAVAHLGTTTTTLGSGSGVRRCSGRRRLDRREPQPTGPRCRPHEVLCLHALSRGPQLP